MSYTKEKGSQQQKTMLSISKTCDIICFLIVYNSQLDTTTISNIPNGKSLHNNPHSQGPNPNDPYISLLFKFKIFKACAIKAEEWTNSFDNPIDRLLAIFYLHSPSQ